MGGGGGGGGGGPGRGGLGTRLRTCAYQTANKHVAGFLRAWRFVRCMPAEVANLRVAMSGNSNVATEGNTEVCSALLSKSVFLHLGTLKK